MSFYFHLYHHYLSIIMITLVHRKEKGSFLLATWLVIHAKKKPREKKGRERNMWKSTKWKCKIENLLQHSAWYIVATTLLSFSFLFHFSFFASVFLFFSIDTYFASVIAYKYMHLIHLELHRLKSDGWSKSMIRMNDSSPGWHIVSLGLIRDVPCVSYCY